MHENGAADPSLRRSRLSPISVELVMQRSACNCIYCRRSLLTTRACICAVTTAQRDRSADLTSAYAGTSQRIARRVILNAIRIGAELSMQCSLRICTQRRPSVLTTQGGADQLRIRTQPKSTCTSCSLRSSTSGRCWSGWSTSSITTRFTTDPLPLLLRVM